MVLMAVGQEDAADLLLVFHQIADVGNHHVDAVHVVIREAHAAVHHDEVVSIFEHSHVLADLIQTAQGDNFQFFCHNCGISLLIHFIYVTGARRTLSPAGRETGPDPPVCTGGELGAAPVFPGWLLSGFPIHFLTLPQHHPCPRHTLLF